jgi:excisionase family DNA binding protein
MELLTTSEAADYLRLKERKLYELVAEGQIPCTKVTGKWLFPRGDLDRWLLRGMTRPPGMTPADPPLIVGGSHDPLLQWALSESRGGLAILTEGSETGYRRFLRGEVIGAAIHFHAHGGGADANIETVRNEPSLYDAVLIGFAKREQGLLVAAGNPLGLGSLGDVKKSRARIVMRPEGAGAQQLLRAKLASEGMGLSELRVSEAVAPTGSDLAQDIRSGRADCGIATRAVANAAGLDFVPLAVEHFDLLMRQRDYFRPPMQALMKLFGSAHFASRAKELGGLDVSRAGAVRWAP